MVKHKRRVNTHLYFQRHSEKHFRFPNLNNRTVCEQLKTLMCKGCWTCTPTRRLTEEDVAHLAGGVTGGVGDAEVGRVPSFGPKP